MPSRRSGSSLVGLLGSVVWFKIFNYLMSLHFHKVLGSCSRMVGVIAAPGISPEQVIAILRKEINSLKSIIN